MPVIDKSAPIIPRTPSDTVAMRGPNSVMSIGLSRVSMSSGIPESSCRKVRLMAWPRRVEALAKPGRERTTRIVEVPGDCRIGKNMTGTGSSVRLLYFPSSAMPTT